MHEIRAEMAATVWKICVDVGSLVAEDTEIVILESMKMEIPVTTTVPGVLRELLVEVGASVRERELIALIDES